MSLLARTVAGKVAKRSAWAGAVQSRLNDFVFSTIQSANQELRYELTTLRGRARELARNNPNAKRFLKLLEQNVVGHKGIRLECQVALKTGKNAGQPDEVANDLVETAWQDWGRRGNCDVTRKHSWVSFQQLVIKTIARDGEAFVRVVEGFPNECGFALQLLDADQVDSTYMVQETPAGTRIEQGVEIDKWGAAVGYHVWTSHPNDTARERTREPIPAREILHLYVAEREGQARGVPWFAPVTVAMRMLDGYSEAELVAARTAAAKMGFITPGEDADAPDPDQPPDANQTMEATPGVIDRLGKGETFAAWDPTHPAGNFDPFVKAQQRLLAIGLNVSYMSLTGDLNGTSWSSGRIGLNDERDGYRCLQVWLIEQLHDPIYRRWLRIASLTPRLKLPNYDLAKYHAVAWRARGFEYVNPTDELAAIEKEIQLGLTSATEQAAERGAEFIDNMKTRRRELDIAASFGITLGSDPAVQETINTVNQPDLAGGAGDATGDASTDETDDDAKATAPKANGNGKGTKSNGRITLTALTNGRTA